MIRYAVAGTAPVPSVNGEPYAALWNASTVKVIYVSRILIEDDHATIANRPGPVRTSTRGTPGSTVTPDIDNDYNRAVAPASGALLDLADYTVAPTLQPPRLMRYTLTATGGGILIELDRLAIPPGTGLAIEATANLGTGFYTFEWDE